VFFNFYGGIKMLKQKFRRGNLVYIKDGACQFNFKQGCHAIILGSYDDFYGGGDMFQYSVMFPDTGSPCSWYEDNQLELIEEGGEHFIEQAKEKRIKSEARNILKSMDLNHLDSGSIVTLLRFLGFDYSISNNYFRLWKEILPVFREIEESDSLDVLKEQYPCYDIDGVWDILHGKI
jgi:hypothetical protein